MVACLPPDLAYALFCFIGLEVLWPLLPVVMCILLEICRPCAASQVVTNILLDKCALIGTWTALHIGPVYVSGTYIRLSELVTVQMGQSGDRG